MVEVLYGEFSFKTYALRYWLNAYYGGTLLGRHVMWLYRRFGRRVAAWIKRNPRLGRFIFGPIFDRTFAHVQRVLTSAERAYILAKTRGEI